MKLKKVENKAANKMNPKSVLQKHRGYCDTIHDDLEKQGVCFFTPNGSLNIDSNYLVLPNHITEVSPRDLGEYLNAFTQQKMYMRTLEGYAELFCEEARREYLKVSGYMYDDLSKNTKLSETAKDKLINSSEEIKPYYEKYVDCRNKAKLINMNIQSIEEAIFLISREVSRRTSDFDNETRDYNVQRL